MGLDECGGKCGGGSGRLQHRCFFKVTAAQCGNVFIAVLAFVDDRLRDQEGEAVSMRLPPVTAGKWWRCTATEVLPMQ